MELIEYDWMKKKKVWVMRKRKKKKQIVVDAGLRIVEVEVDDMLDRFVDIVDNCKLQPLQLLQQPVPVVVVDVVDIGFEPFVD